MTTAPQDGCGAATLGWHPRTDITSEPATDGRRRQAPESGDQEKIRSEEQCVSGHKGASYGFGCAAMSSFRLSSGFYNFNYDSIICRCKKH